ncbi:hypothetical protein TSACC_3663 [Terrimicrobium sacchariphilum]|uniref:Uncharacterized protein n=1 Tax=Terrimicrobium sacchariphilum TaxID=690879 RepID=A0A146GEP6_TERSA|nr:hypothetical protein [Terrimicrobium sacchariphilum]GAT35592.1 hypothetical protein TSACC_3663 [Terrimicrobium sacchariphilum]
MKLPPWFDPRQIYQLQGTIRREGQTQMFLGDLQYDEGQFWFVQEWQTVNGTRIPAVRWNLDAQLLEPPVAPNAEWYYPKTLEMSQES